MSVGNGYYNDGMKLSSKKEEAQGLGALLGHLSDKKRLGLNAYRATR